LAASRRSPDDWIFRRKELSGGGSITGGYSVWIRDGNESEAFVHIDGNMPLVRKLGKFAKFDICFDRVTAPGLTAMKPLKNYDCGHHSRPSGRKDSSLSFSRQPPSESHVLQIKSVDKTVNSQRFGPFSKFI
jgi:hypothetical protein